MLSIKENVTNEIVINKSKFITKLIKVNNKNDVKNIIFDIKKKYKDATHYCYAYVIENSEKANDDGEPNGTAGLPILNALKQNNLNNVLCVVIRYFGGVKLGSGGLVRAYNKATNEAIKKSFVIDIIKGKLIIITFLYEVNKTIDYLLKDVNIINKDFNDNITYHFEISNDCFDKIKKQLVNNCLTLEIKKEITL